MDLLATAIPADLFFSEPLGLPVFSDLTPPHREAGRIDFRLQGKISRAIKNGDIDPDGGAPTIFPNNRGEVFPLLIIRGVGPFRELNNEKTEAAIRALALAFLRGQAPVFGIAARDFRKPPGPLLASAQAIFKGIANACEQAGPTAAGIIRLHWDEDEIELMVQELRRCRYHFPACRDWRVDRAPEDREWIIGDHSAV